MKMSADITRKDFSVNELIELTINFGDTKNKKNIYLSIRVHKDSLRVLPLKHYYEKENIPKDFIVPCIDLPYFMIKDYKKLDKSSLLYLVNTMNPHIINAIENI
jgi:hypothetical protein